MRPNGQTIERIISREMRKHALPPDVGDRPRSGRPQAYGSLEDRVFDASL